MGWHTSGYSTIGGGAACVQVGLAMRWPDRRITLEPAPRQGPGEPDELEVLHPGNEPGAVNATVGGVTDRASPMAPRGAAAESWRGGPATGRFRQAAVHGSARRAGSVADDVDVLESGRHVAGRIEDSPAPVRRFERAPGGSDGGAAKAFLDAPRSFSFEWLKRWAADLAHQGDLGSGWEWYCLTVMELLLGEQYGVVWPARPGAWAHSREEAEESQGLVGDDGQVWNGDRRRMGLPADAWQGVTSWAGLLEMTEPVGGIAVAVMEQPGGSARHAVAFVHTGDRGVVLLNPEEPGTITVTVVSPGVDLSELIGPVIGVRALVISPDGRIVSHGGPVPSPDPRRVVEALVDPPGPYVGAQRKRATTGTGDGRPGKRQRTDTAQHDENTSQTAHADASQAATEAGGHGDAEPTEIIFQGQLPEGWRWWPWPSEWPDASPVRWTATPDEAATRARARALVRQLVDRAGGAALTWGQVADEIADAGLSPLPGLLSQLNQEYLSFYAQDSRDIRRPSTTHIARERLLRAAEQFRDKRGHLEAPDEAVEMVGGRRVLVGILLRYLRDKHGTLDAGLVRRLDQLGMRWATEDALAAARSRPGHLLPVADGGADEVVQIPGHDVPFNLTQWKEAFRHLAWLSKKTENKILEVFGPAEGREILDRRNETQRARRADVGPSGKELAERTWLLRAAEQFHAGNGHLEVPREHVEIVAGRRVALGLRLLILRRGRKALDPGLVGDLDRLGMRWATEDALTAAQSPPVGVVRSADGGVEEIMAVPGHQAPFNLTQWKRAFTHLTQLPKKTERKILEAFGLAEGQRVLDRRVETQRVRQAGMRGAIGGGRAADATAHSGAGQDGTLRPSARERNTERYLQAAKKFFEDHDHLEVPRDRPQTFEGQPIDLGKWLANRRTERWKLDAELVKRLDGMGMRWATKDALAAALNRPEQSAPATDGGEDEIVNIPGHNAPFNVTRWKKAFNHVNLVSKQDEKEIIEAFGPVEGRQILNRRSEVRQAAKPGGGRKGKGGGSVRTRSAGRTSAPAGTKRRGGGDRRGEAGGDAALRAGRDDAVSQERPPAPPPVTATDFDVFAVGRPDAVQDSPLFPDSPLPVPDELEAAEATEEGRTEAFSADAPDPAGPVLLDAASQIVDEDGEGLLDSLSLELAMSEVGLYGDVSNQQWIDEQEAWLWEARRLQTQDQANQRLGRHRRVWHQTDPDGDCFFSAFLHTAGQVLPPSLLPQSVTGMRSMLADALLNDDRLRHRLGELALSAQAEQQGALWQMQPDALRALWRAERGEDRPDWDDIDRDIRTRGSWENPGGDLVPWLAATLFRVRILVVSPDSDGHLIVPFSAVPGADDGPLPVVVLYRTQNHWDATDPLPVPITGEGASTHDIPPPAGWSDDPNGPGGSGGFSGDNSPTATVRPEPPVPFVRAGTPVAAATPADQVVETILTRTLALAQAVPRSHIWVDPASGRELRSAFDVRRAEYRGEGNRSVVVGGRRVPNVRATELTVSVRMYRGAGVSDDDVLDTWERLTHAVDVYFNEPRYHFPRSAGGVTPVAGDLLRVRVVPAEEGQDAHLTVTLVPYVDGVEMAQGTWVVGQRSVFYAHEIAHQIGLRDEWLDASSEHPLARPDGLGDKAHVISRTAQVPGSLMGDFDAEPPDPELRPSGLRPRHFDLLAAHIGDVTPVVVPTAPPEYPPPDYQPFTSASPEEEVTAVVDTVQRLHLPLDRAVLLLANPWFDLDHFLELRREVHENETGRLADWVMRIGRIPDDLEEIANRLVPMTAADVYDVSVRLQIDPRHLLLFGEQIEGIRARAAEPGFDSRETVYHLLATTFAPPDEFAAFVAATLISGTTPEELRGILLAYQSQQAPEEEPLTPARLMEMGPEAVQDLVYAHGPSAPVSVEQRARQILRDQMPGLLTESQRRAAFPRHVDPLPATPKVISDAWFAAASAELVTILEGTDGTSDDRSRWAVNRARRLVDLRQRGLHDQPDDDPVLMTADGRPVAGSSTGPGTLAGARPEASDADVDAVTVRLAPMRREDVEWIGDHFRIDPGDLLIFGDALPEIFRRNDEPDEAREAVQRLFDDYLYGRTSSDESYLARFVSVAVRAGINADEMRALLESVRGNERLTLDDLHRMPTTHLRHLADRELIPWREAVAGLAPMTMEDVWRVSAAFTIEPAHLWIFGRELSATYAEARDEGLDPVQTLDRVEEMFRQLVSVEDDASTASGEWELTARAVSAFVTVAIRAGGILAADLAAVVSASLEHFSHFEDLSPDDLREETRQGLDALRRAAARLSPMTVLEVADASNQTVLPPHHLAVFRDQVLASFEASGTEVDSADIAEEIEVFVRDLPALSDAQHFADVAIAAGMTANELRAVLISLDEQDLEALRPPLDGEQDHEIPQPPFEPYAVAAQLRDQLVRLRTVARLLDPMSMHDVASVTGALRIRPETLGPFRDHLLAIHSQANIGDSLPLEELRRLFARYAPPRRFERDLDRFAAVATRAGTDADSMFRVLSATGYSATAIDALQQRSASDLRAFVANTLGSLQTAASRLAPMTVDEVLLVRRRFGIAVGDLWVFGRALSGIFARAHRSGVDPLPEVHRMLSGYAASDQIGLFASLASTAGVTADAMALVVDSDSVWNETGMNLDDLRRVSTDELRRLVSPSDRPQADNDSERKRPAPETENPQEQEVAKRPHVDWGPAQAGPGNRSHRPFEDDLVHGVQRERPGADRTTILRTWADLNRMREEANGRLPSNIQGQVDAVIMALRLPRDRWHQIFTLPGAGPDQLSRFDASGPADDRQAPQASGSGLTLDRAPVPPIPPDAVFHKSSRSVTEYCIEVAAVRRTGRSSHRR
jgi:hypothetical protein